MTLKKKLIRTFALLLVFCTASEICVSLAIPAQEQFIELMRVHPEQDLGSTVEPLKQFIAANPDFVARGTAELAYRAIYAGQADSLLAEYQAMGTDRILEKVIAYSMFEEAGYPPDETETRKTKQAVLEQAASWDRLTMARQCQLLYADDGQTELPDSLKHLPADPETGIYLRIAEKVASLELDGALELVRSFPADSDFLWMVVEEFPNTNGEIERQLPVMEELAKRARNAGNLFDALRMEAQIITVQINYSGKSHLDEARYDRVINESNSLGYYINSIDLVSNLALRHMFDSNYEKSLAYALKAVELARQCHLPLSVGIYSGYAGICYSNLAQYDKALEAIETACQALDGLDPGWYWVWREKLAYLYMVLGDTDTSEAIYLEVLDQNLEADYPLQAQYTYRNLTELYLKTGELDKAASYMARVDTDAFPGMGRKNKAIAGRLAFARGEYGKARRLLEACLDDPAPMDVPSQLDTWITLASTYQELGQLEKADLAFRDAGALFEEIARTRFTNLAYRSGFFQQYQKLYLNHISFLVNRMKKPDEAWLLVRHLQTGPFQYFADACVDHFRDIVSLPEGDAPVYTINQVQINPALRAALVRVEAAAGTGPETYLAGPGGVFRTDGMLYTRIADTPDIFALAVHSNSWAGITRKTLILDGSVVPLTEDPDPVLTGVCLTDDGCFIGSSTGLYHLQDDRPTPIYDGNVIGMLDRAGDILFAVSGEGLFACMTSDDSSYPVEQVKPGPGDNILKRIVALAPWRDSGAVLFTPGSVLFYENGRILRSLPFSFGIINRAVTMGPERWLIETALQQWYVLDGSQFLKVDSGGSPLRAGCTVGPFRFWSTESDIYVDRTPAFTRFPLPEQSGGQPPAQAIQLDEHHLALMFQGRGISIHRISDGSFLGFFPAPVEQFSAIAGSFSVLETNEQLVLYHGSPLNNWQELKRIYTGSPIVTLCQDGNDGVLASLIGGGLAHWTPDQPPVFFGQKNGLPGTSPVTAIMKTNGHFYLGTNDQIFPFDGSKTGPAIPIEGKVRVLVTVDSDVLAGTNHGIFRVQNGATNQAIANFTTGAVYHMAVSGSRFAAATETGVYMRSGDTSYKITVPDTVRYVGISEKNMMMVSENDMLLLHDPICPVLLRQGGDRFCLMNGVQPVNLTRNPDSNVLLDTGAGVMVPVSHQDARQFQARSTMMNELKLSQLSPFGAPAPFRATPVLHSDTGSIHVTDLNPGVYRLTVWGGRPFDETGWPVELNVVRTVSRVWWLVGLLVLVIGALLISRYVKWKQGRYVGHYKLLNKLGEGGMGTVYRARDIRHSRTVALKILNRHVEESIIERFRREWQMLDKLAHPNIIKVFDRGEHMEQFFIAMEYLHGHTLDEILDTNGPIQEEVVVSIAISVAHALEAVHAQQIIHRDLKPANIMVLRHSEKLTGRIRPDQVKLMDFGISKEVFQEGLTSTGNLVGTLLYLAPESLSSLKTDHRSDIYALGVLMYELLAGVPPFYDENQVSIYYKIVNAAPPPFPDGIEVSENLKGIIWRCLMKDPDHRYQTAGELIADLTQLEEQNYQ